MTNFNGLALYGVDDLSVQVAFGLAMDLFATLKLEPNSCYYYEHEADQQGETVSAKEVSVADLEQVIGRGEIDQFRLNHSSGQAWDVGCSFIRKESAFGEGMSLLDLQFSSQFSGLSTPFVQDFLKKLAQQSKIAYGIGYQASTSMFKVATYALGLDGLGLYSYENGTDWLYQLPSRSEKEPHYDRKLRLVYPVNILTSEHLTLTVEDLKLQDWIGSDSRNGQIKALSQENFLWTVEADELDRINRALGQVGCLISWKG